MMSSADWRALIEAYLDGRLSAEAFSRRFLEAWRAQRDARLEPIPPAIESLFFAVEAFDGPAQMADIGATNDDDMRASAQRALRDLSAEPSVTPHTFDRTRAREDIRRFQVQMTGCAGIGCVIALIWVGLCVLQIYFVSEWIQSSLGWGAWPSAVVGFILAFVPIIGNLLAFLGATAEGWPSLLAAIVFFAAPAATLLTGWTRWRRQGPPRG